MTRHRPTGWNTWDFRGFNRLTYLERGRTRISLLYAIWDEDVPPPTPDSRQIGRLYDCFRWSDVTRLGPHAPLGLPAELELKAGGTPYQAVAVERDGALELTVTPLAATRQRVVFMLTAPAGETPVPSSATAGSFAGYRIELRGATWPTDYFLNIAEPYAVGAPGQPASVRVARGRGRRPAAGAAGCGEATHRESADGLVGDGALRDAPQAMMRAVTWNTLFDTRRHLVSSPVSRDWCYDWRGVIVFCWDTYLVGTMVAYESPALARFNFEAVTAAVDELGFVPNYYMAHGARSLDRSMPPLGAYLIWKTQAAAPDAAWLKSIYPKLRRWHGFWMRQRDGNGNGLLEWGSNAEPAYEFPQLVPYNPTLRHSAKACMWESGLDNSPMYDDVAFNAEKNVLELDDVALSSYYAMDCEALAALAECLGRARDARSFRRQYAAIAGRINALLWDEEHGIYCNRHWDGRFSRRWSPTSFFPLIAGVAPRERAERMVREHLLNEREFWGAYVIPSIARSDPAYPDNDYWRGRIWGPFNFLVAEGLRRYRFDDVAAELARKGLEMFMRNWREDGGVYENYNAQTGRGGDVWNAARLYHWGGLLVLIALQELIDIEPRGFLRLGSVAFPEASVANVRLGGDTYDVALGAGVRVRRNGRLFLDSSVRAVVRLPLPTQPERPIELSAAEPGELRLYEPGPTPRAARLDGRVIAAERAADGSVRYRW